MNFLSVRPGQPVAFEILVAMYVLTPLKFTLGGEFNKKLIYTQFSAMPNAGYQDDISR